MRISANTLPLNANEQVLKAVGRRKSVSDDVVGQAATPPANIAESRNKTEAPAGLEKVLARLQAMPVEERTTGQSNAAERISRNIARYLDVQSMASSTPVTDAESLVPAQDSTAT